MQEEFGGLENDVEGGGRPGLARGVSSAIQTEELRGGPENPEHDIASPMYVHEWLLLLRSALHYVV